MLLLRIALGGIAVALGALYLMGLIERTPLVWAAAGIFLACGICLVIGFMTPPASLLVGLCVLAISFSWVPAPPFASLGVTLVSFLMVVTAMGIALLGPGAFSVDGHFFGRREIVIPPRSPEL